MALPADQEMLALAAISYRGYNLLLPENIRRARLRQLMEDYLQSVPCVSGKWQIEWGPADFRSVSPGFDDALMYVAQSIESPSMVAIVIRGTNPISLTDWI